MSKDMASKLDIVIVGAGGFGREVYGWAKQSFAKDAYQFKGFLDKDNQSLDGFNLGLSVLGSEDDYVVQANDRFLLAVGDVDIKKKIVLKLKEKGAQFLTMIHPTALVIDTATIGEGVVICPFATVSGWVVLGDFVMMNMYASCGHDAKVGKYSILSPYCIVNGVGTVGEQVFLGSHSTVARLKTVGNNSKVSANSAVLQDVPPRAFVVGVPGVAKVIF